MGKFKYLPLNENAPLPGRDFEEQTEQFLEEASQTAKWDRIENRPGVATGDRDGLMSANDKAALDAISVIDAQSSRVIPAWLAAPVGYQRHGETWRSSPTCIFPPKHVSVVLDDDVFFIGVPAPFSLNNPENWLEPAYAASAARAGRDFYFHVVRKLDDTCAFFLSARPSGIAESDIRDSQLLGGFHCLCAAVGNIPGHALSELTTGDILPASVWDLWHCPACSPAGMVYDPRIQHWVDVYLPAESGEAVYDEQVWQNANKRDVAAALAKLGKAVFDDFAGANPALPARAGGNVDASGRRAISDIGLEDTGGYRGCAVARWA